MSVFYSVRHRPFCDRGDQGGPVDAVFHGDCRVSAFVGGDGGCGGGDTGVEAERSDISVICDLSKLDEKGCHGAPDWIIEVVSPSSKRMGYF